MSGAPSPGPASLTVSAAAPRGGRPGPAAAGRSAATRRPSSASPWWPCPLRPRRRHRPALRPALSRAPGGSECCPAAAGAASGLAPGAVPALRGPGPVTAAMNGAGAARGRGRLPSAPPPSWIRPVGPRVRPAPGLPRPPERCPGPGLGSACAHLTPAWRHARLYVEHTGARGPQKGRCSSESDGRSGQS